MPRPRLSSTPYMSADQKYDVMVRERFARSLDCAKKRLNFGEKSPEYLAAYDHYLEIACLVDKIRKERGMN